MNEMEKAIFKEESEMRRKLADETDNDFALNARKIIPFLPSSIRKDAEDLIDGAISSQTPSFRELFYVPIDHDTILRRAGVYKDFTREISQVLNEQPKVSTIIADGDCASLKFTRSSIINSRLQTLALGLKYIPGSSQQVKSKGKDNIDAYQNVIVDFLGDNPKFRAVGVDSTIGQVLGTLDMIPNLFTSRRTAQLVRFRLGVEARTRLSLNRTVQLATDERVIFFQGKGHEIGISEWCKRNSVELKTMTPPSIQVAKPIFFRYS